MYKNLRRLLDLRVIKVLFSVLEGKDAEVQAKHIARKFQLCFKCLHALIAASKMSLLSIVVRVSSSLLLQHRKVLLHEKLRNTSIILNQAFSSY